MIHAVALIVLCWISLITAAVARPIEITTVSAGEAQAWVRHVTPLPKTIDVRSKVSVRPTDITVVCDDDPLVSRAAGELRRGLQIAEDAPPPEEPVFWLVLRAGGPDAEPLRKLKNAGQAYRIMPGANSKGIKLVALTPEGVYYAAKTLRQMIGAHSTRSRAVIPLAAVTDWPDLEYRGLWGADNTDHLMWMSDIKMNIAEQISAVGVDENGRPWARMKPGREPMVEHGPQIGIKPIPSILHLEQVGGKGVFQAYPNLRAQGGHENGICYSQPQIVDILAGWMTDLAGLPGVAEIDVWMAENLQQQGGCRCDECGKTDRSVLEARAIIAGWKKARERFPDLGLIVLTSEETESSNQKVFEDLPKDVKVWYYHSLLTYTAANFPMIRQYVADHANRGRWIGVCPSLVAYVHFTQPFTGADFIRTLMNEYADKDLSGLLGYIVPRLKYAVFNMEAAAEWSWNAKGRSTREFALSYAVRHGLKDPERFAEWSETIGPVAWDVYASHWPGGQQRDATGKVAQQLREGTLPKLGFVLWDAYCTPFGGIGTEGRLDDDVRNAQKAVDIARRMGDEEYIQESLVVQGYINSLKALWELRSIARPDGTLTDRDAAERWFRVYATSLDQAVTALPKWEDCIERSDSERFTDKPVAFIQDMIRQMQAVAEEYGIEP